MCEQPNLVKQEILKQNLYRNLAELFHLQYYIHCSSVLSVGCKYKKWETSGESRVWMLHHSDSTCSFFLPVHAEIFITYTRSSLQQLVLIPPSLIPQNVLIPLTIFFVLRCTLCWISCQVVKMLEVKSSVDKVTVSFLLKYSSFFNLMWILWCWLISHISSIVYHMKVILSC